MDGVIIRPISPDEYLKIFRKKYMAFKNSPIKDCSRALELLKKYSTIPNVFVPLRFSEGEEEYLFLQIFPQRFKDDAQKKDFVSDIRYLRNIDQFIYDYGLLLEKYIEDYTPSSEKTIVLFQLFKI